MDAISRLTAAKGLLEGVHRELEILRGAAMEGPRSFGRKPKKWGPAANTLVPAFVATAHRDAMDAAELVRRAKATLFEYTSSQAAVRLGSMRALSDAAARIEQTGKIPFPSVFFSDLTATPAIDTRLRQDIRILDATIARMSVAESAAAASRVDDLERIIDSAVESIRTGADELATARHEISERTRAAEVAVQRVVARTLHEAG